MDAELAIDGATDDDTTAHTHCTDTELTIRITRQGKLRVWVKKALDFFHAYPDKPLVLYSSPVDVTSSTIPRLVSVVEIIKREYLKGLDISAGNLSGLHQYNQLLFDQLEESSLEDGENRRNAILLALDGHSHVKQRIAPHMMITLSTKAIPDRHEERETYQTPTMRRISKAAKARMRKRTKNQSGNAGME
ncbi:hypothetical protein PAXRUDRAFT_143359 [Paxillus rubicundulus Ve08.2h10]|uniref:Uncharacterized protein n=1 Tax=Paxillus rubicundulus Ve08.2h10 TaxID=930991 RepID=A0A0D0DAQ9_9AGAM|nr:hypothetical protein PAXRUDRAFT_143359 [Paxillus rubicundulus Ve08.2h10]